MENLYETLGISKTASDDEIKKAYRKKAMEYHPDRHQGDAEKESMFKKINAAYQVLGDPEKKAHYDRFWTTENTGWGFSGNGWWFGGFEDLGDIFESFFGWGRSRGGWKKTHGGDDISIYIDLKFEDIFENTKKDISFERNELCEDCNGHGTEDGKEAKPCGNCHGNGVVYERTQSLFGYVQQTVTCPKCHGSGVHIEKKCASCHGSRFKKKKVTKTITIPAGIENEVTMKISGEWNHGIGKRAGDVYITISVPEEYKWLVRQGHHLHYTLYIDPVEAVLGSKKEIPFPILGKKEIFIPAGTQHGDIQTLKKQWVPRLQTNQRWDLYIELQIQVPKKLSKNEREMYESIAKEKKIHYADKKGIFGKLFE